MYNLESNWSVACSGTITEHTIKKRLGRLNSIMKQDEQIIKATIWGKKAMFKFGPSSHYPKYMEGILI